MSAFNRTVDWIAASRRRTYAFVGAIVLGLTIAIGLGTWAVVQNLSEASRIEVIERDVCTTDKSCRQLARKLLPIAQRIADRQDRQERRDKGREDPSERRGGSSSGPSKGESSSTTPEAQEAAETAARSMTTGPKGSPTAPPQPQDSGGSSGPNPSPSPAPPPSDPPPREPPERGPVDRLLDGGRDTLDGAKGQLEDTLP